MKSHFLCIKYANKSKHSTFLSIILVLRIIIHCSTMKVLIVILHCVIVIVNCYPDTSELDGLNIDPDQITLSGFSSGSTFAQHLQFSYSSLFAGIAVFSHNHYRCGPGNGKVDDYDKVCTKEYDLKESEYYNPELVHGDIQRYLRNRQIEDPDNLRNKRLYVYTGLRSIFFTPAMGLNILRVYERYIQNANAIRTRVQDADLVMPSNKYGMGPCTEFSPKTAYVSNCGFSGAFEALNHLLPEKVTVEPTAGKLIRLEPLQTFDQEELTRGIINDQLDTIGFFYVPSKCKSAYSKCLLHFYFHGCLAGREFNGTRHIENSGFLEVAELNNIVMIFPQAISSLPENKIGCWDTFGISGPLYATKEGAQVKAVKRILDKVLEGSKNPSSSERPGGGSRPLRPGNNVKSHFLSYSTAIVSIFILTSVR